MLESNNRIILLAMVLILSLFLLPVSGFASNGFTQAERTRVEGIITESYAELPGIEFEFDEPAASYESLALRPFTNLAISVPNLSGGLVIGLAIYGETGYLLMAVELPQEMNANYGVGLVDLSAEKAVYAAEAELSNQEGSVNKVGFQLSPVDEGSPNLDLVIDGKKYVLKTTIPKSL